LPAQQVAAGVDDVTPVVVFYEKPGCLSNARQKELLCAHGHRLEVRDLLVEAWTPDRLRRFFGPRPVAEWFNSTAPRIKNGEIDPQTLDAGRALELMVGDPILIRRPLMEIACGSSVRRCCGFEPGPVLDELGIRLNPAQDLQSCSKPGADARCEPSWIR